MWWKKILRVFCIINNNKKKKIQKSTTKLYLARRLHVYILELDQIIISLIKTKLHISLLSCFVFICCFVFAFSFSFFFFQYVGLGSHISKLIIQNLVLGFLVLSGVDGSIATLPFMIFSLFSSLIWGNNPKYLYWTQMNHFCIELQFSNLIIFNENNSNFKEIKALFKYFSIDITRFLGVKQNSYV